MCSGLSSKSSMDKLLLKGIEQLCVLTPRYCNSMEELAKDLGNALDETSDLRSSCSKVKKGNTLKGHSQSKCISVTIGSSIPKSSAVSEDSSSSSDDKWILRNPNSNDSDDVYYRIPRSSIFHSTSWRHTANVGESDSVNENFHPSREPRRKRKFKRMSVDPPSVVEHNFQSVPGVPLFSQKSKRLRNLRAQKLSKLPIKSAKLSKLAVSQLSAEMENICKKFATADTSCGKRKRCAHERSIDCSGYGCKGFMCGKLTSDETYCSNFCHHMDYDAIGRCHDISSSGLSSSESECGILTNDESREADDEQSDFFHEAGPSYGVPNVRQWWLIGPESQTKVTEFKKHYFEYLDEEAKEMFSRMENYYKGDEQCDIYREAGPSYRVANVRKCWQIDPEDFKKKYSEYLSEEAKEMFRKVELNRYKDRKIRSGRRRLDKGLLPVTSNSAERDTSAYVPAPNEYSTFSICGDSSIGKLIPNEKKRRRRMPPLTSCFEDVAPVPESNIGFRMLQNMGWEPGTGLGPTGTGILSPVKASPSRGTQGLGFRRIKIDPNCMQTCSPHFGNRHSSQAPPPPPPSPQPILERRILS